MLTILFVPLNGVGHINACFGLANVLKARGHRAIFTSEYAWKGTFIAKGFEEEVYYDKDPKEAEKETANSVWERMIRKVGKYFKSDAVGRLNVILEALTIFTTSIKYSNSQISDIIAKVNPDVIVIDNYVSYPCIESSGVPYVWLCSANPLSFPTDFEDLPPSTSGLALKNKQGWSEFRKKKQEVFYPLWKSFNEWFVANGGPQLPKCVFGHLSDYLNVYILPKELDYPDLGPTFFRMDATIKNETEIFEVPEKLRNLPGKLIYVSMGSFGSTDEDLMKRLVHVLGKSRHRIIMSKGPNGDSFELPNNIWGENFLPQLKILQIVDLVITHGGNNTVTETLFNGKPMIVLHLFGDQLDNAARIEEEGLGMAFHPFNFKENDFLEAIDQLIENQELLSRLKIIAENMRHRNSVEDAVKLIENITAITKL